MLCAKGSVSDINDPHIEFGPGCGSKYDATLSPSGSIKVEFTVDKRIIPTASSAGYYLQAMHAGITWRIVTDRTDASSIKGWSLQDPKLLSVN